MVTRPRMTAALRKALSRLAQSPLGELEPYLRRTMTADGRATSRIDPRTIENLLRKDLAKVTQTDEGRLYTLTAAGCALSPLEDPPVITPKIDPAEAAATLSKWTRVDKPDDGHVWTRPVGHAVSHYSTADMSIDEWRSRRFEYVGASEVSAVLGLNPYRGPLDVYLEKVGIVDGTIELQVMRLGTLFEPTIIEFARREYGLQIYEVPQLLGHPEHDCLRCNLDGLAIIDGEEVVVECKHAGARGSREHLKKFAETGEVTPGTSLAAWYVQIQAQLVVTGLKRALLIALCDKDFHVIGIERDEAIAKLIVDNVPVWWNAFVVPKTEPPATRADRAAIDRKYQNSDSELDPVELTEELGQTLEELRGLRSQKAAIDEQMSAIVIGLKAALGEREVATHAGERAVTWKSSDRTTVDLTALREAHPDIAQKFQKTTTSRRFNY